MIAEYLSIANHASGLRASLRPALERRHGRHYSLKERSKIDMKSERRDVLVRRLKAVALLILIVLAASAPFGWYSALSNDAQRTELCNSVLQKMARNLEVLIVAVEYGKFENYEQSSIVLSGYFAVLEQCPQPPLDDNLLGTLNAILSYARVGDTGLWQDPTALQTLATGLSEARTLMLANDKQAALDRLQQLRDDLRALGFGVP